MSRRRLLDLPLVQATLLAALLALWQVVPLPVGAQCMALPARLPARARIDSIGSDAHCLIIGMCLFLFFVV